MDCCMGRRLCVGGQQRRDGDWEWLCVQEEGCRRETRWENKPRQSSTVFRRPVSNAAENSDIHGLMVRQIHVYIAVVWGKRLGHWATTSLGLESL